MALEIIKNYITERYDRWLDYAKFHCDQQGLSGHEYDVLNEVTLSLLQKTEKDLIELFEKKKDGFTELDFFVLRMLKLNITSSTAPYRHKIRSRVDHNADFSRMEIIEDDEPNQASDPDEIVENMNLIRETLNELPITDREREVFEWKYFHGNDITRWEGKEKQEDLYAVIRWIKDMLKVSIMGGKLTVPIPTNRLRTTKEHQSTLF